MGTEPLLQSLSTLALMSDINFITSQIGAGKSLLATRVICSQLEDGERMISTSIPLYIEDHWHRVRLAKRSKLLDGIPSWWHDQFEIRDVPGRPKELELWVYGLATWCHYEIKKSVDLTKRLRLLTHEEVFKFYLHVPLKDLSEVEEVRPGRKAVFVPALTERDGDGGCVFVLDEVHLYFASRNYMESGLGVERYQSQLRHLNDDLWMVSQDLGKVDKNFRRNCTNTYELVNYGKMPMWAGVTIPDKFAWRCYSGVPVRGDKPHSKGSFALRDRGICYLYNTMAGVGVSGGIKADEPRRGNQRHCNAIHSHAAYHMVLGGLSHHYTDTRTVCASISATTWAFPLRNCVPDSSQAAGGNGSA